MTPLALEILDPHLSMAQIILNVVFYPQKWKKIEDWRLFPGSATVVKIQTPNSRTRGGTVIILNNRLRRQYFYTTYFINACLESDTCAFLGNSCTVTAVKKLCEATAGSRFVCIDIHHTSTNQNGGECSCCSRRLFVCGGILT